MRARRVRAAVTIVAALALAAAVSLPPSAPGWLFWSLTLLACGAASAWGALDQSG